MSLLKAKLSSIQRGRPLNRGIIENLDNVAQKMQQKLSDLGDGKYGAIWRVVLIRF